MNPRSHASLALILSASLYVHAPTLFAQDAKDTVFLTRVFPNPLQQMSLFVADADGGNERPLLSNPDTDYNPAWSKNGDWIVFTSEREGSADLFRVHTDGSGMERLTDDPAYDDQAAVSPDGTQVAYVTTRADGTADIWTLNAATRETRALTSGAGGDFRPAWSPDGNWIAFSSDRGQGLPFAPGRWEAMHLVDIYVVRPDGTGLRRVTNPGGFCGSPKWAADGKQIIAYCMSGPETLDNRGVVPPTGNTRIVSIDINTGAEAEIASAPDVKTTPHLLAADKVGYIARGAANMGVQYSDGTSGPRGAIKAASWSPDGEQVVFDKVEANTTPPDQLDLSMWSRLDDFDVKFAAGMQPAVDHSSKRYAAYDFLPPPAINDLYTLDTTTNQRTVVFRDEKRMVMGPQWSRQGDSLIFALGSFGAFFAGFHDRFVDEGDRINGGAQIAMVNVDGSGFRELISGEDNNAFPSLSPDGKTFVFRTFGTTGSGLRLYDMASGEITTLTNEYDNFPLWSPRGDLIMFSRLDEGNYEIFTIRPDGTDEKQLTSAIGNDAHQGWSPDGEHIVFASSRMGFKDEAIYTDAPQPYGEIFVMRFDGTDVRQLTDNQWEEGTPAWQRNTEAASLP